MISTGSNFGSGEVNTSSCVRLWDINSGESVVGGERKTLAVPALRGTGSSRSEGVTSCLKHKTNVTVQGVSLVDQVLLQDKPGVPNENLRCLVGPNRKNCEKNIIKHALLDLTCD